MKKLGVFVCWCGTNIADSVDVKNAAEAALGRDEVIHAEDYIYMCSDPGQQKLKVAIAEKNLDAVVVACCTPRMHENTFRKAAGSAGLNPFMLEIANIREQCSWVHQNDMPAATAKAINIIDTTIDKIKQNSPLTPLPIDLKRRACVIGGGIAGIMSALDLADAGHEVVMIEREPVLGGHMAQIRSTFPHFQDARELLQDRIADVIAHPRITLCLKSELEELEGYVGNFTVTVRSEPAFIHAGACTNCGLCIEVCPVSVADDFNRGLTTRRAIFRHGSNSRPIIRQNDCLHFAEPESEVAKTCRNCVDTCPEDAIDLGAMAIRTRENVGAIVMATGFDQYDPVKVPEYGAGQLPDVIDGLAFERLLDPDGPTGGRILRPSDGKVPNSVLFIHCVGSRDPDRHKAYCSRTCCMYTAKQARLYKRQVADGTAFVSYIDIRSDSREFEEFVQAGMEDENLVYIRGRVAKVFADGDTLTAYTVDTLSDRQVVLKTDMVVLAMAMEAKAGVRELSKKMNVTVDGDGFLSEAHIKLYPVESSTRGVFLAGCGQSPKDISDTVSQALAAAGKVQTLFANEKLIADPLVSQVADDICSGCGVCVEICPYDARVMNDFTRISTVNQVVCQGCGACVAACPNNACEMINTTSNQVIRMIGNFARPVHAVEGQ